MMITGYGIYAWIVPPDQPLVSYHYHADVWWGAVMTVVGAFYTLHFNPLKKS